MKNFVIVLLVLFTTTCFAQDRISILSSPNNFNLSFNHSISSNSFLFGFKRKKPRLDYERITGEAFVGLGLGYIAAISLNSKKDGIGDLFVQPFRLFGTIGGVSGGVYVIGNLGRETGSFFATVGTATVSGLVFGLIGATDLALTRDDVLYRFVVPGMTLGAVLGFNYTRTYKKHKIKTSILNYHQNYFEFGVPAFSAQRRADSYEYIVNVLDFRW